MKYTSQTLIAEVDQCLIHTLYDPRDPAQASFVIPDGLTGSASYTLIGEEIHLGQDKHSSYHEHLSAIEPLPSLETHYELLDNGLCITLRDTSDSVSQLGLVLDLNFMSKHGTAFEHQLLPASPYTSPDGRVMYCIFKRPDERCLVAAALTPCDGWHIKYSPENFGHFIEQFHFLASFDKAFGGSNRHEISVILCTADNTEEAFSAIGRIFNRAYALPIISGAFSGSSGDPVRIRVSEGSEALLVTEPNQATICIPLQSNEIELSLHHFGFTQVVPMHHGEKGIPAILWNGISFEECLRKLANKISPIYHCDPNLCEGGCWTWFQLKMLQERSNPEGEAAVLRDLDIIMGKTKPYIRTRTIVPEACEGHPPYHMFQSDRVQEQFFGVSILLEAFRYFRKDEYLDFAMHAMDTLLDYYLAEDGAIRRGIDCEDYTTVTCPVINLTDFALFLQQRDPLRAARYRAAAISMADHVVNRGFNFPTEAERTERIEMEEGSISCSALTVLYVAFHLDCKPEYLTFAGDILRIHKAWRMDSPDARMFGSTLRWWETIWEGDGNGPGICAGHAWTIWRSEAQFFYGILSGNVDALIDSWNGFITNFAKLNEAGDSCSSYCPDYICGGGRDDIRVGLMTRPLFESLPRYRIVHDYPLLHDFSLSRYAWIRADATWRKAAAVVRKNGHVIPIHCSIQNGQIITTDPIEVVYLAGDISAEEFSCTVRITTCPEHN